MLDKSLELCYVLMEKTDTDSYPVYALPDGYRFRFYRPGDEVAWAELEVSVGQFSTTEEGVRCFEREFVRGQSLRPQDRVLFVLDPGDRIVATGALWNGIFKGRKRQRLHWIAVNDACAGKGIAKALVTRLFDLYRDLGFSGFIYVITETWCYEAVNIYTKFGFRRYSGENPVLDFDMDDVKFRTQTDKGWRLIDEKLAAYTKRKAGQ